MFFETMYPVPQFTENTVVVIFSLTENISSIQKTNFSNCHRTHLPEYSAVLLLMHGMVGDWGTIQYQYNKWIMLD